MEEENKEPASEQNREKFSSPSAMETEKSKSLVDDSQDGNDPDGMDQSEEMIKDYNFDEINRKNKEELAESIQSDQESSVKGNDNMDKFIFSDVKKQIIIDRLHRANDFVEVGDLESALCEFNKILFYDKSIAEAYAERAEIYLKLCDFSSAIANFKKAIQLKYKEDWEKKLNQLYFLKGLGLIEEGYCNDVLNLVKTIESDDIKFIYLRALAYIKAGNKLVALEEIEKCLEKDPNNVEVLILKGKLLWSNSGSKVYPSLNEYFWKAHAINPDHTEVVEFLSIMKPKAEEKYQEALRNIFKKNISAAFENISQGLELFRDMPKLLLLRASLYREQNECQKALNDLERASKFMFVDGLEHQVNAQIGLTYNTMGISLFSLGKYHDSVTIFNEALNFMDQDPGVYINRGDAYRELKKFNLALSDYHYALDLGGQGPKINFRLALTHYALGVNCFNEKDYEGAKIEFSRSIDYNSSMPDVFVNRAKACLELGLVESAYSDIERTLEIQPDHSLANSMIQNFNRETKPLFQNGKFLSFKNY
ncbi:unnamed protein product [Moneuplotes crassus]|uniref:Uncharacterized protein n=2 Tax=Euplotes crassus TaxID=5936 RepID=A0AAD1UGU8_EUPCR|nr:unnamed protein product [Moneuplotes crassus]